MVTIDIEDLRIGAEQLFNYYQELQKAGFTKKEALFMIGKLITGTVRK